MQRFPIQSIFVEIILKNLSGGNPTSEDGSRVFASASHSLPEERDKKEAAFQIE